MNINAYTFALLTIGIIYGCLTIFAGFVQLKQRKISILSSTSMILGGLFLIASITFNIFLNYSIIMLISGLLLIHIASINNGLRMYGEIHLRHHIIKLGISMVLVVLFLLK